MQIGKLHEEKKVSDDLSALACQPDTRVRLYSACIVHGVRYHTIDREKKKKDIQQESSPGEIMMVSPWTSMVS